MTTLLGLMVSATAFGQPCPGTMNGVFNHAAQRQGMGTYTHMFVSSTSQACVGVPQGNATDCDQPTVGDMVYFTAIWPNLMARTTDATTGGCVFTCPGGTCFVDGIDGLPVELMSFSVGPDESQLERVEPESE